MQSCALKSQSAAALASGRLQAYARGDSVSFTSGFVLNQTGGSSTLKPVA